MQPGRTLCLQLEHMEAATGMIRGLQRQPAATERAVPKRLFESEIELYETGTRSADDCFVRAERLDVSVEKDG